MLVTVFKVFRHVGLAFVCLVTHTHEVYFHSYSFDANAVSDVTCIDDNEIQMLFPELAVTREHSNPRQADFEVKCIYLHMVQVLE